MPDTMLGTGHLLVIKADMILALGSHDQEESETMDGYTITNLLRIMRGDLKKGSACPLRILLYVNLSLETILLLKSEG